MSSPEAQKVAQLLKEMADRNNVEDCRNQLKQLLDKSLEARIAFRDVCTEGKTSGQVVVDTELCREAYNTQLEVLGYGQDQLGKTRLGNSTGILLMGKLGDTPSLDATRLENADQMGKYVAAVSSVDDYMARQDYGQIYNDARSGIDSVPPSPSPLDNK